jgi:hypothetical protein
MSDSRSSGGSASAAHLHAAFLAALPKILGAAGYRFRRISCPATREDRVCETVALCWVWYLHLTRRGRNPDAFMGALARYGAAAVHGGRGVCGLEKARDVLSRRCRRRGGFSVTLLPEGAHNEHVQVEEALHDNARTPVPDQVQFRLDFPAWASRLPAARRRLVGLLALGHRTKDVAAAFALSEGRVSQLRRELCSDYAAFCEGGQGR